VASSLAVATVGVLIVGVPALVIGAGRGPAALAVVGALMVVAAALAAWLTAFSHVAWPGRSKSSPRPPRGSGPGTAPASAVRYGMADLDQVADGLDTSARRLSSLLAADRGTRGGRLAPAAHSADRLVDAAGGDDRGGGRSDVVREEGSAALTQAERLADVVTQLLSPVRRATAASAALTGIDEIVRQQVIEWEPAFRRVGRKARGDRRWAACRRTSLPAGWPRCSRRCWITP